MRTLSFRLGNYEADVANSFLRREHRDPFVVPEIA